MSQRRYNHITNCFILVIITILIISNAAADPKLICDYCKRQITDGEYVSAGDVYFHADHFLCSECNNSLVNKKFFNDENKYYCTNCYNIKFVPKCNKCGESLTGRYINSAGKKYHKKCYNESVALRCDLCQNIIDGEYLLDYWGNKYHFRHKNNDPICTYCGRYLSESVSQGGFQYDDGRHICGICKKKSIGDIRKAQKLMTFLIQKLNNFGIEVNAEKIELQLVDRNRLSRLAPDRTKDYAGLTLFEGTKLLNRVVSLKFNIYILIGMPEENIKATLVHELMHVWLYTQAPMEMDPALSEGSCNFAAYLLLQNDRGKMVAYVLDQMERDPGIFYGDGYRRVKKMVRRLGVEAWLEFLKKNKNFPSGY